MKIYKKLVVGLICLVLLSWIVVAGVLPKLDKKDKTLEFEKEKRDALVSINLDKDITVGQLECDGTYCKTTLKKQGAINTEIKIREYWENCTQYINITEGDRIETVCNNTVKINYTTDESLAKRDNEIKKRLNKIAEVTLERNKVQKEAKLGDGKITINEKKY